MPGEVGQSDLYKNALGVVIGIKVGNVQIPFRSAVNLVSASRALAESDNGQILEMGAAGLTLTIPKGLSVGWHCHVIPNGTTSLATSGGALVNGAATTLTRAATGNPAFDIIPRVSVADSYVVTGS